MPAPITLRTATPEDAPHLAQACYNAFTTINKQHNFPPDIPSVEAAMGLIGFVVSHPYAKSIVADKAGTPVGSSFLWLGEIDGIGPVTVAPSEQGSIGRQLMEETIRQSDELESRGVRLVQAAFNTKSMALYMKLGFDVKEPLVCLQGPTLNRVPDGYTVRPLTEQDVPIADEICRTVHGHVRTGDVMGAVLQGEGVIVERNGKLVGYSCGVKFFGHSVALDNDALIAMISAAPEIGGPGLLLPSRNGEVFRWCLENGLRIIQPMTLMARGFYQEPNGAYLCSILY